MQRAHVAFELRRRHTLPESTADVIRTLCSIYSENQKLDSLTPTHSFDTLIQTASKKAQEEACILLQETVSNPYTILCSGMFATNFTNMCATWKYAEEALSVATQYVSIYELTSKAAAWICSHRLEENNAIQRAYGGRFRCPTSTPQGAIPTQSVPINRG